jgi:hypothetical protein
MIEKLMGNKKVGDMRTQLETLYKKKPDADIFKSNIHYDDEPHNDKNITYGYVV